MYIIFQMPNQYWGQRYFRGQLLAPAPHHDPYFTLHQHQPISNAELAQHHSHHLQHSNVIENNISSSTQNANSVIELDSEEYPNSSHNNNINQHQLHHDISLATNSRKRFLREPIENENAPKKLNPMATSFSSSSSSSHLNVDDKSRIPRVYHSNLPSPTTSSNSRSTVAVKNEIIMDDYFEMTETLPPEQIGNHLLSVEKKDKPNMRHICNNRMLNVRSDSERVPCDCFECFPKLGSTSSQQKRLIKNRQACDTMSSIVKFEENVSTTVIREEPIAGPSGLNSKKRTTVADARRAMLTKLCADSSDSEDEGQIVGQYFGDESIDNAVQLRLVYQFNMF